MVSNKESCGTLFPSEQLRPWVFFTSKSNCLHLNWPGLIGANIADNQCVPIKEFGVKCNRNHLGRPSIKLASFCLKVRVAILLRANNDFH